MSLEFDHFTDEDRQALAQKFGTSPFATTSDHADAYVKGQYDPKDQERVYAEERDRIKPQEIKKTVTSEIYIERFLEDCFRTTENAQTLRKGRRLLSYFYSWKEDRLDDYYALNSRASNSAAEIIERLTIQEVNDYVGNKAELYSSKAFYTRPTSEDKAFRREKAREWNLYKRIVGRAAAIDYHMPQR